MQKKLRGSVACSVEMSDAKTTLLDEKHDPRMERGVSNAI